MSDAPATQVVYDGKFLQMVRRGRWEFVRRKKISGIVGIIAVTDAGKLLLVEQHREPFNQPVIEIPAGLAGDRASNETEALAEAAARELEEETGYRAAHLERLCEGTTSAGLCDERVTLFRATGLAPTGGVIGDGEEEITVHEVPVAEVPAWLEARARAGAIVDLKVYSALYFVK